MCFEFEAEYYWRSQEARKALEAEEKRKQASPAVPAKPAEPEKARGQSEPVPV
jgi:hypothetical protein